jgi:hypothetical protein
MLPPMFSASQTDPSEALLPSPRNPVSQRWPLRRTRLSLFVVYGHELHVDHAPSETQWAMGVETNHIGGTESELQGGDISLLKA